MFNAICFWEAADERPTAAAEQDAAPDQAAAKQAADDAELRAAAIKYLREQYTRQIKMAIAKRDANREIAIAESAPQNPAQAEPTPKQFTVSWTTLLSSLRVVRDTACSCSVPEECKDEQPKKEDKVMFCDGRQVMCGKVRATGPHGYIIELDEGCTLWLPAGMPFGRSRPADLAPTEALTEEHEGPTSAAAEGASAKLTPQFEPTEIPSVAGNDVANMRDVAEDHTDNETAVPTEGPSPQTLVLGTVEYTKLWPQQ